MNLENRRAIILESPSGKGEEWLKQQTSLDWAIAKQERPAKPSQMAEIHVTPTDGPQDFCEKFRELRKSRAFVNFMESCTHCGICIDKCHEFLSTADVNNAPVGRAELVRTLYKKGNRLKPEDVDLNKLYTYYYQCTECRRCSVFCPQGIDQSEITRNVRNILTSEGRIAEYVAATMAAVYKTGNNLGLKPKAQGAVIDFLKEELKEETGKDIDIPLDKEKAEILLIPSSADLYVNTDTLKGYAKVMHALGKDWTMDSEVAEVANFGLFASEKHLREFGDRVVSRAIKRGVKYVVWGECGHGWRAATNYTRFRLAEKGLPLTHILQFTDKAIQRGQLKLDRNKNDDLFNYHDPCNYARGGNLVNEPRRVLKAVVRETVESKFTKQETFCCGAGGGLLAHEDAWEDFKMWGGWPSLYYAWKTGAHTLISPCAIDKAQYPHLIEYHKIDMKMKGLMDLVGYAVQL